MERRQSEEPFAITWPSVMVTVHSQPLRGAGAREGSSKVGCGKTCCAVGISSRFLPP